MQKTWIESNRTPTWLKIFLRAADQRSFILQTHKFGRHYGTCWEAAVSSFVCTQRVHVAGSGYWFISMLKQRHLQKHCSRCTLKIEASLSLLCDARNQTSGVSCILCQDNICVVIVVKFVDTRFLFILTEFWCKWRWRQHCAKFSGY